jgi:hypothetical protein
MALVNAKPPCRVVHMDRVAHLRQGREVNHRREPLSGRQRAHRRAIRQIGWHKNEPRIAAQDLRPACFSAGSNRC